jgi:hypothetical protein
MIASKYIIYLMMLQDSKYFEIWFFMIELWFDKVFI